MDSVHGKNSFFMFSLSFQHSLSTQNLHYLGFLIDEKMSKWPEFERKRSQTQHQRFDKEIIEGKNDKKVVDWRKNFRVVSVFVKEPNYGQISQKTYECQNYF